MKAYCIPYNVSTFEPPALTPRCTYGDPLSKTLWDCPVALSNASQIGTRWVDWDPQPIDKNGPLRDYTNWINVEIPATEKRYDSNNYICGVKAVWIRNILLSTTANSRWDHVIHEANDLPGPTTYREVTFQSSWRESLTPLLDKNKPYYTSLSSILEMIISEPETIPGINTVLSGAIGATIVALVADGMSRIGLAENFDQSKDKSVDLIDERLRIDQAGTLDQLLDDVLKATLPGPRAFDSRCTVTLTGLAYQVKGLSDVLSLATLLIYAACALAHIAWSLFRRQTCGVYEKVSELLLLSLASPTDQEKIANTSAGILSRDTYTLMGQIRHVGLNAAAGPREEVQILLRKPAQSSHKLADYTEILPDVQYGQTP